MVHPKITPPLPFSLLHSPKNPHPHANHPRRCQRAAPPSPRHPSDSTSTVPSAAPAMRSLRILSTPTAQRSSAPFIAHCLPLPYLCSVQVVPGIPVSHPPPPSHRRSRLSSTSMGSLDLGAAQEDRRHSRRRTRSSSGFLLLPCRMGLLAGDILPSHPQCKIWFHRWPRWRRGRSSSSSATAGADVLPICRRRRS
uniref:Uncharacterized protein n=1 Tax=Oryza nivara TaxID=4536 RepID=A0A0E0FKB6_ORYNI